MHGEGCSVFDSAGRQYIDLFASAGTILLGHNAPEFNDAVASQLRRVIGNAYRSELRDEFISKLAPLIPRELDEAVLLSTGGEAVEAAVHISQLLTGRIAVVSIEGSYHGRGAYARHLSNPKFVGTHHPELVPALTLPWALIEQSFDESQFLLALHSFLESVEDLGCSKIACVVVEPIQGTNGNRPVPRHVLRGLANFCRSTGSMYVIDECLTGGGRTGKFLSIDDDPIPSDFLLLGKGIGNGIPLSILLTHSDYIDHVTKNFTLGFSTSFGGNLLAISAGNVTLDMLFRNNLIANASAVGKLLRDRLSALMNEFELSREIQGRGLMLGFCTKNRNSDAARSSDELFRAAIEFGLYGIFQSPFVRINPSLTFDASLAEDTTIRLRKVLEAIS
ncbi:aminotransferase class III-fold pyridoxal phosphate-dependent enzyme [Tardiphaga sp. OK245]|uniref:aminotransferase class III-fold pyridoxal phosphate-dependent enzyme n=1 Tax=Tardiphaga sp. OK245 TaxID=1855306 RepID=UPI000B8273E6|nr:aminotransferase class III-fold pyridoxal phosphate-dependent enzyme [Tardiphaga sp. OK245]